MGQRGPIPQRSPGRPGGQNAGPRPRPARPRCPKYLNRLARQEWRRIVPELERMGLLSCVDGAALEGYCNAYANMVEAQRILNERGMTFVTPSGYIAQRPEVGIVNKSLALIRGFLTELGLSPAARARMAVGPTENETDPMEELLRWSPSVAIPAAEDRETNETVRAGD